MTGDATEAASVARLVTGADGVLSALGPRGAKSPALMARAGQNIVAGLRPDYPPKSGWKMSRSDVAQFVATVLTEGSWIHGCPALAY
jgi:hypothetical protein